MISNLKNSNINPINKTINNAPEVKTQNSTSLLKEEIFDSFEKQQEKSQTFKLKNKTIAKFMAGAAALGMVTGIIFSKINSKNQEQQNNNYSIVIEDDDSKNDSTIITAKDEEFKINETNETEIVDIQEEEKEVEHILPAGLLKGVLEGKEDVVEDLCNQYGVETKLIAAIMGAETGWGQAGVARINNPMSYRASGDLGKNNRGFGIFSTPEAGLEAGIRNIADYKNRYGIESIDFDHIYEIGRMYCGESSDEWASSVRSCYYSIK